MTIEAKVIARSSHPGCPDIFSVQARYPRFIHPEVMTHRDFSRSASSSRAVPIWRMILSVLRDPAMPVSWGRNKPGMQAGAELTGFRLWVVRTVWMLGCYMAVALAWVAMNAKEQDAYPTVPYGVTVDSLARKGLISRGPIRITKEGELVLELCRRAGLVQIALRAAA